MRLCAESVDQLSKLLDPAELSAVIHLAKKAQTLENKWKIKTDNFYKRASEDIADLLDKGLDPSSADVDFEKLFVDHAFDVMFEAFETTKRMPAVQAKLAAPQGRMPRSLKQLMEWWDLWRKEGKAPKRPKDFANKIKKKYLQKVQEVTKKYNDRIRAGEEVSKAEIARDLQSRSKAESARSRTIVETETTRYWNTIRRDTYDESPDVTHYLYLPIRDAATTKWCKTRRNLVYAKGDPLLDKETPPIHWNCRSEILPLSPLNPAHKRIIDNKSMWRRNHSPEPLPHGWNA